MEVLSEVLNDKVKSGVESIKKGLAKKPEMLEEQIEITDEGELTLESGQTVSLELEEKE